MTSSRTKKKFLFYIPVFMFRRQQKRR